MRIEIFLFSHPLDTCEKGKKSGTRPLRPHGFSFDFENLRDKTPILRFNDKNLRTGDPVLLFPENKKEGLFTPYIFTGAGNSRDR